MAKVYHISGIQLSQCRKICKFYFGDFYSSCRVDELNRTFIIKIHATRRVRQENGEIHTAPIEDYVDVEYFKKFWGPQFKLVWESEDEVK